MYLWMMDFDSKGCHPVDGEGYSSRSMFQFRWGNHIFWARPTFWSVDHGERKNGGDTQAWHSFRRGACTMSDRY